MTVNPEVIKSAIRWTVATFGAAAAGWFAHSGYITSDQVLGILNSPVFASIAFSVVSGIFGLFAHTQSSIAAAATEIAKDPTSPIAGIVTTNNTEGRQLANRINDPAVIAPAGTAAASMIAKS